MVSPTPFRFAEFKSAYGPKYSFQPNVSGFTMQQAMRLGLKTAAFGGAGGVALLLFTSKMPKIREDILQHIPLVGGVFAKEAIPASDNPF